MSGPFVFISRSRIKPGKRDQYLAHCQKATEVVEAEEPRMIAFNSYESADGTETSTIQVHPDAASMELHLKIFVERLAARAFGSVETYEIDVFGTPSDAVLETLKMAEGAQVRVLSEHLGGFLRPQPL